MNRRRIWSDDRGGVAVIVAGTAAVFSVLLALVVDLGLIALRARQLQGTADLAAMVAAADLPQARRAAEATVAENLGPGTTVAATPGRYVADPDLDPDARFTPTPDLPNAVRIDVAREAPLYFGRWILGRSTVRLSKTATAAVVDDPPLAIFSIGSRLARLEGGLANQVLSSLTGSTVSLSALDYRALAGADVDLLTFSDALATELALEVGDYDGLAEATIDTGRALRVLDQVAGTADGAGLGRLAQAATGRRVSLDQVMAFETERPDLRVGGLRAEVAAMDLATALLEAGAGDRQLSLDLGARPGLADVDVTLAIGERPNRSAWLTVTADGDPIIRTAQARLAVRARTASAISGLARVELPLIIELAGSEARLNAVGCRPQRTVELGVRPGAARAILGRVDASRLGDFKAPLTPARTTLVSVAGLAEVTGRADVRVADQGFRPLTFDDTQIRDQLPRTASTQDFTQGLISSLIQDIELDVHALGLGIGLGGVARAVGLILAPLGPVLDGLINSLLSALGLGIGQADLIVHDAICPDALGRPQLVG